MTQDLLYGLIDGLVKFATDLLIPFMGWAFLVAVVFRLLVFYTIRRELWFAREFHKRIDNFIDDDDQGKGEMSFYATVKRLLEKTYYELFELRTILKRRKPDYIMAMSDRIFLIQQGSARLVHDTLRQIKHLRSEGNSPKIHEISKTVFERNPAFNKVFGVIPAVTVNDILNIMPGMFIIGGIFGTFVGIMKALPTLSTMDLTDVEGTKLIMDQFLLKISFSMSTSIVGIVLSVSMRFVNTLLSPEKTFIRTVDHFENSLDRLWNMSDNNTVPSDDQRFDEHKDSIEALAEESVKRELSRMNNKTKEKRQVSKAS